MDSTIKEIYWDMLGLGVRIKKVNLDNKDYISCSYPKDLGYGILEDHIADDYEITDFYISYIK